MATISVMILTYNHAPYLAQAIESVLKQETTHALDIFIMEDCSTDGTQDIVRQYIQKYPDRVRARMHKKNIGGRKGVQQAVYEGFMQLNGDYCAILEGDDYWSDLHKLEKQVSFLEVHPEFVMASHNTVKTYEDGTPSHRFMYNDGIKPVHNIHDFVALSSFFHISTLVFRNMRKLTKDRSFEYIKNPWCCDIYLLIAHAQFGKLHYVNEDMSVYRCHKGGTFSNMPAREGRLFNINGHRRFNRWLRYRYLKGFSFAIFRLCRGVLKACDKGELPPLSSARYYKYKWLGEFYGKVYDFIDNHPRLDPAVFWYGEPPKASEPRFEKIRGYEPDEVAAEASPLLQKVS
jgi:glycosyltransferase involved in cell wall biosynthesis